jgi:hypothetical protein
LGEMLLLMHELISLAAALKKNVEYFLETESHIGELLATRGVETFRDLPRITKLPPIRSTWASSKSP